MQNQTAIICHFNRFNGTFRLLLLLLLTVSCKEKENPQYEVGLVQGSFDSEFNRYKEFQQHGARKEASLALTEWSDTLWQNDRAHRQLILWSDQPFSGCSYEVLPLVGEQGGQELPASTISIRYALYVMGDKEALDCGSYPSQREGVRIADALAVTPVTSLSDTRECIKLWLTAQLPNSILPDLYKGVIRIKQGATVIKSFDIRFRVVNHRLPQVADWNFHLDLWQFPFQLAKWCKVTPFTDDYFTLVEPFYRKLADTGQKCITTYIKDGAFNRGETMVRWTRRSNGEWLLDFTDFDRYVEHMMEWGINSQINCFSLLGWNPLIIGYRDEVTGKDEVLTFTSISDTQFNDVWQSALTQLASHLQSKGWFEKSVLYLDEDTQENTDLIIALIRRNNPNWKVGLAGRWMSESTEKQLYDYSTIWGYNRHSVSNNKVATFYTSCSQERPNNSVTPENMVAEMTWMAWHARAKGLNGYVRWAYDYWQKIDPMDTRELTNTAGDFEMIYRSSNDASTCEPVSSIRLELLRLGIQDYEKMLILNDSRLEPYIKNFYLSASGSSDEVLTLVQQARKALKEYSLP